jgi:hypothetical protein
MESTPRVVEAFKAYCAKFGLVFCDAETLRRHLGDETFREEWVIDAGEVDGELIALGLCSSLEADPNVSWDVGLFEDCCNYVSKRADGRRLMEDEFSQLSGEEEMLRELHAATLSGVQLHAGD